MTLRLSSEVQRPPRTTVNSWVLLRPDEKSGGRKFTSIVLPMEKSLNIGWNSACCSFCNKLARYQHPVQSSVFYLEFAGYLEFVGNQLLLTTSCHINGFGHATASAVKPESAKFAGLSRWESSSKLQ